uniref:Uncharacterized protein n=1 Tax=Anguilla anguilla TaxID=7936 RepID=A0A0E9WSN7_ANGAN
MVPEHRRTPEKKVNKSPRTSSTLFICPHCCQICCVFNICCFS